MKVCLLTVQVPFVTGGAESLVGALRKAFQDRGFECEVVAIPFKWYPASRLLDCMLMARLVDLTEVNGRKVERVVSLKFPAYYVSHPHNVCWLMHQHRQAYDLYGTRQSDLWQTDEARRVAAEIRKWDNYFLPKAQAVYTISKNISRRLQTYNGIASTPLYPPLAHEDFYTGEFRNYILAPGRVEELKRQHLLIEALQRVPEPVKVIVCGQMDTPYGRNLKAEIVKAGLASRVEMLGYVNHEQKKELYANCLAVYNGVQDEDYGYVTLEAFAAGKPVITHTDSGGPLEFVVDSENGFVTEAGALPLAERVSELAGNIALARAMGRNGADGLRTKSITWDNVVARLISP